jgi:streptogramin lyase
MGLLVLLSLVLALGLAAPAQAVTIDEFTSPVIKNGGPLDVTAGPDGNLWFTELSASRVGRITPAGQITDWSNGAGVSLDSQPRGIAAGPDGNLWFVESPGRIGRITTRAQATEFSAGITPGSGPESIALGPDGNLWFTELKGNRIGRITPAGAATEFSAGISPNSAPSGITAGPDGNVWFTEILGNRIGRITPAGVVTEFSAGITPNAFPAGITAGPDGNLWFVEAAAHKIGRITPAGVVTEFSAGLSPNANPQQIAAGADGNLWFTEGIERIGRITPEGVVTEYANGISPNANPAGITAGPDGNLWFAEYTGGRIGRVNVELPPDVTTGGASAVTASGARVAGTVRPIGAATSYAVEYGRTTAYGSASAPVVLPAGADPVAVTVALGGLAAGARYHFRVVASNASGTRSGGDRTFTTTAGAGGGGGGGGPGGPAARADRTGPRMTVTGRTLVLRRGRVRIRLGCPLLETLGCRGTVRLRTASRPVRLLGRARFAIGAGRRKAVAVRVSRRGLARIRGLRRVRVRAIVTASDRAGNRRTRTALLTLRRR